jgi:F-type H+-transporting ATPase subunit delta
MKITKIAATTARRLFGYCQTSGVLDESKLRLVVGKLVESKPRDYAGILSALLRLTRLDQERRKVTVESATELDATTRQRVLKGLQGQYGANLIAEYHVNSALLGGLRIRVGDDVYDGSVQGRLDRLSSLF